MQSNKYYQPLSGKFNSIINDPPSSKVANNVEDIYKSRLSNTLGIRSPASSTSGISGGLANSSGQQPYESITQGKYSRGLYDNRQAEGAGAAPSSSTLESQLNLYRSQQQGNPSILGSSISENKLQSRISDKYSLRDSEDALGGAGKSSLGSQKTLATKSQQQLEPYLSRLNYELEKNTPNQARYTQNENRHREILDQASDLNEKLNNADYFNRQPASSGTSGSYNLEKEFEYSSKYDRNEVFEKQSNLNQNSDSRLSNHLKPSQSPHQIKKQNNAEQEILDQIEQLEKQNRSLKQKLVELQENQKDVRIKMKNDLKSQQNQVLQEVELLNEKLSTDIDKYEDEITHFKELFEKEEQKNLKLIDDCQNYQQSFEEQNFVMTSQLKKLKKNYEDKLGEFEKNLRESNKKINQLQSNKLKVAQKAAPVIKKQPQQQIAAPRKPQLDEATFNKLQNNLEQKNVSLQKLEKDFMQTKGNMQQKYKQIEEVIEQKDDMIKQLTQNNDLQDQQIKKMEQLMENFQTLFHHMNEEKELINLENQKLKEEIDQYREVLKEFEGMYGGGENGVQEGNQQIQEEEYENTDGDVQQNMDGNDENLQQNDDQNELQEQEVDVDGEDPNQMEDNGEEYEDNEQNYQNGEMVEQNEDEDQND